MVSAVVFDMGGVVVELGNLEELLTGSDIAATSSGSDNTASDAFARWLTCETVRAYERGWLTTDQFGAELMKELALEQSASDFLMRFAAWPQGLFPGSVELLRAIQVPTAVLSNTNALHWETQIDAQILQSMFDHSFLSFELGMVKPDVEIFDHVVNELGFEPAEVVYFDDNQPNVDAALSVGLDAFLARGPDEARLVLAEKGVV